MFAQLALAIVFGVVASFRDTRWWWLQVVFSVGVLIVVAAALYV
jgi:hypothetical protein